MAVEIANPQQISNKIQNYLKDPVYRETVENAANYNSRLSVERTFRLPFLDNQTGVAQSHSMLFMTPRQRLPGLKEGQIYTYPSRRWRKKRRQYLSNFMQPRIPASMTSRKEICEEIETASTATVESSTSIPLPVPNGSNDDSRDSTKEETISIKQQDWYYDDLDIPDSGEFDEPDADSDYDYEDSYSNKKKRGKKPAVKNTRQTSTRGRRKITYDPITDSEKPFACDLCGARYKTRPGLTYHYTHSHKDKEEEEDDEVMGTQSPKRDESSGSGRRRGGGSGSMPPPLLHPQQQQIPMQQLQPPTLQPQQPPPHFPMGTSGGIMSGGGIMGGPPPPHLVPQLPGHLPPPILGPSQNSPQAQPAPGGQHIAAAGSPQPPTTSSGGNNTPAIKEEGAQSSKPHGIDPEKPRVQPSTYCDFCLGDVTENKKSGSPEELVSCSDCGRSGHPTCLQFTPNMIISVKKYRWQCIECKCCSICGTSDNDDQLLFCDDCDRGYHMYCLSPPLDSPPEGSWACALCLEEFHKK